MILCNPLYNAILNYLRNSIARWLSDGRKILGVMGKLTGCVNLSEFLNLPHKGNNAYIIYRYYFILGHIMTFLFMFLNKYFLK